MPTLRLHRANLGAFVLLLLLYLRAVQLELNGIFRVVVRREPTIIEIKCRSLTSARIVALERVYLGMLFAAIRVNAAIMFNLYLNLRISLV